ncbi:MAG: cytidylate kinase family protein [Porphyromonadaceae bacterium]|nr:cytidylate kinase family protein [Porphyromonadaceae bacterium]
MRKNKIGLRILLLLAGIFVIAFGVALSIRSDLGTTSGSSLPYVLNLLFPSLSVGTFTVLMNVLFVLIQVIILGKKTGLAQLLQMPLLLVFGFFIDLNLFLTRSFIPDHYIWQLLTVVLSCFVIAFGIFLELKADAGYLPGEGMLLVISETYNWNFGKVKVCIDSSLVAVALFFVLIFYGRLDGIREGTVIAAFLVGAVAQWYRKEFTFVDHLLATPIAVKYVTEPYMTTDNFVITISRQYGSGGHAVGEYIARKMGIAFYDSKLIDLTAIASGFTPEYVEKHEQKMPNGLLNKLYYQNYAYVNEVIPPNDELFMVQTQVIRNIAAGESCVIVGRAANFILKGHKNSFNVFVHADQEFRRKRVIHEYMTNPGDALKVMEKKDREREDYYLHYTGKEWNDLNEYDMTVETSLFGIEETANMIIKAAEARMSQNNLPVRVALK